MRTPGWWGERTVNLAETPVPGQLWDAGAQLEVEGGPVGRQVLIRGTHEEAGAVVWLTAHAAVWWGQLGGVVIDLEDLYGQGPGGRAGRGGCRQKRPGRLLALRQLPLCPIGLLPGGQGPRAGTGGREPRLRCRSPSS